MRVQVYRNLHNGLLSIKDKASGLVVGHAADVVLQDARFVVREAGRQRVLRERKKNVHAWVEGRLSRVGGCRPYKGRALPETTAPARPSPSTDGHHVAYNPFKGPSFFDLTASADIAAAEVVTMAVRCVGACPPVSMIAFNVGEQA